MKSPPWAHAFLQKAIDYIQKDDTRKQIQELIIDPLLNHIMSRVFPYIILTCVLFVLLLIVILITLGIIITQIRGGALSLQNPLPAPI